MTRWTVRLRTWDNPAWSRRRLSTSPTWQGCLWGLMRGQTASTCWSWRPSRPCVMPSKIRLLTINEPVSRCLRNSLNQKLFPHFYVNLKVQCPRLKPFLSENIYEWDLPKKCSAWSGGANTPAPQPKSAICRFVSLSGNVDWGAGVFAPSDQAENFFGRSYQYIFTFRKGFSRGHQTFKFTKVGK